MNYSTGRLIVFAPCMSLLFCLHVYAQSAMINVDARETISLDGDWQAIIDPGGAGDWRRICLRWASTGLIVAASRAAFS